MKVWLRLNNSFRNLTFLLVIAKLVECDCYIWLATPLMEFPCGGASWTLDQHNSMKIRENPESVLPGLFILLHPNTMC